MALLLTLLPGVLSAQLGAGISKTARLEPTSNSSVAVSEFTAGLLDLNNVQPIKATVRLKRAIDADPSLGIARVFLASATPGLTTEQRITEMEHGVADAAKGSMPEFLVASAVLAQTRGQFEQAQTLLQTATKLLPNDPNVAFQLANVIGMLPGSSYTATIEPLRMLTMKFPDYAPSFSVLAYNRWRSGDRAGALETVKSYVKMAPNEANAHASFGEILSWSGNFEDAISEFNKALEVDNTYFVAGARIASLRVIEGKGELARTALNTVLSRITTPVTRVAYLNQIASTFVLEGNVKQAMMAMEVAQSEATKNNLTAAVSNSHINMAMVDALIGDGKSVSSHISAIGEVTTAIDKAYYTALTAALTKQNAMARTALETLKQQTMGKETPGNARFAPTVNALILINESKATEAIAELNRTDLATPITRAVLALAHAKAGNIGIARSLRDEILGDRQLNLNNGSQVTARVLVKRIT